ncbi:MAG: cobalt-precorrin 5A hydrolase, partial [Clostridia bacterium]|nr:cobalt-precorrin 5A hydrolase [Clostridia bacterium]
AALAERLRGALEDDRTDIHSTERFASKYGFTPHTSVKADMGDLFSSNDALIFISAAGIAVREIAPHLKSKTEDPAVLVMDDGGKYVIPILSGHIGGANALARKIEALTGAKAVVTTATDGAGRFSCDAWATKHNCAISSMRLAKKVSAAILTREIPVFAEFPLPETLPCGLFPCASGELGIHIGIRTASPFEETLRLIPRIVTVGVGCRKGTPEETVTGAVNEILQQNGIDPQSVKRVASIDVKKEEPGLLACAEKLGVPAYFYTAEELDAVPGEFHESEFVRQTVGVGSVCERAAVKSAGGKLIIPKTATDGVTVAAAMEDWSVVF